MIAPNSNTKYINVIKLIHPYKYGIRFSIVEIFTMYTCFALTIDTGFWSLFESRVCCSSNPFSLSISSSFWLFFCSRFLSLLISVCPSPSSGELNHLCSSIQFFVAFVIPFHYTFDFDSHKVEIYMFALKFLKVI